MTYAGHKCHWNCNYHYIGSTHRTSRIVELRPSWRYVISVTFQTFYPLRINQEIWGGSYTILTVYKVSQTEMNINNKNGCRCRKLTVVPLTLSAVWSEIQTTISTHSTHLKNVSTLQCRYTFLRTSGYLTPRCFQHGRYHNFDLSLPLVSEHWTAYNTYNS